MERRYGVLLLLVELTVETVRVTLFTQEEEYGVDGVSVEDGTEKEEEFMYSGEATESRLQPVSGPGCCSSLPLLPFPNNRSCALLNRSGFRPRSTRGGRLLLLPLFAAAVDDLDGDPATEFRFEQKDFLFFSMIGELDGIGPFG